MTKNVLVISPIPSHPHNAGNKARIYTLISSIKDAGHEITFVYVAAEIGGNIEDMEACWGDRFYSIPYSRPAPRLVRKLVHLFGITHPFRVDDWYSTTLDDFLRAKLSNSIFDVVILEYVFLSKCLKYFDKNVLKIIDTIDVFSNRHQLMNRANMKPAWFFTTPNQEALALNRADVVLAISESDQLFFSNLVKKKVITIGHIQAQQKTRVSFPGTGNILFVGSGYPMNAQAIQYFIQEIFPKVRSEYPKANLQIAGKVCDLLEDYDGCEKLGALENLEPVYHRADVVIVPLLFGTGESIKIVEALGYSKPVVTTAVGARGMLEEAGKAFLVGGTPEEFAAAVLKVLNDRQLAENLSANAYNYIKQRNRMNINKLTKLLLDN